MTERIRTSTAVATVLKNILGTDGFSFVAQSESVGIANRTFTSFSQAAEEAGMSRIYGGIHYGFDNVHGLSSGGHIGDLVTDTLLRPVIRINAGGPALSQYHKRRNSGYRPVAQRWESGDFRYPDHANSFEVDREQHRSHGAQGTGAIGPSQLNSRSGHGVSMTYSFQIALPVVDIAHQHVARKLHFRMAGTD